MTALLAALGRDPAVRRRRWIGAAAVAVLVAATGAGARRLGADRRAMCAGGPARAASVWGPERRHAVERAFAASGNPAAARAFATTAGLIGEYVGRWTQLYTEACEATHVGGEQSGEVLDLRMDCLGERLASVRALGDVLVGADAHVVDNGVAAASGLPSLARCSDVAMLRAVVRPPDDPTTRARVDALRGEVAKVNALVSSGQCERASAAGEKLLAAVTSLAYQPLTAEAAPGGRAARRGLFRCEEGGGAGGRGVLRGRDVTSRTGRHRSGQLRVLLLCRPAERPSDRPALAPPRRGRPRALSGTPDPRSLDGDCALDVVARSGETVAAIEEARRALALQEKIRGPVHMDVAVCLQNLGTALIENGQYAESEAPTARSLQLMRTLFGDDSARTAALLVNHGEVLTALHRLDEARASIEQALAIWRKQNAAGYYIGVALLDLGRLELAAGNSSKARATLVEAGRNMQNANPQLSAEIDFALAEASWAVPSDRRQALRLARHARAATVAAMGSAHKIAEMDAWLAERDTAEPQSRHGDPTRP